MNYNGAISQYVLVGLMYSEYAQYCFTVDVGIIKLDKSLGISARSSGSSSSKKPVTSMIRPIRLNSKLRDPDLIGKNALVSGFGIQEKEASWLMYRFKKRYLKYAISEIIERRREKGVISTSVSNGESGSGGCRGDSGSKIDILSCQLICICQHILYNHR